jgi:hypothetical protein
MFKFGTIGAFKQVRNNPRCKATADLYNGLAVLPDDATGNAPTPSTEDLAQGDLYVVFNNIDKPEVDSTKEFKVLTGEYVRAFRLADIQDMPVEIDDNVVGATYSTVAVGDKLVALADGTGKWGAVYGLQADGVTANTAADFKINLEVLEKSAYGDNGLYCKVVVN